MRKSSTKCPACGANLTVRQVRAVGVFECPFCETKLEASENYAYWICASSVVVAIALAWAMGFNGLHFVIIAAVFWNLVVAFAINTVQFFILPKLEVWVPDDGSLGLRGGSK